MREEREVKAELKEAEKDLKKTVKLFQRYDNHDDMDEIERLRARVDALKWVLS